MTPDEIDNMEAGPDLDALVAERVMGLVWDESLCRVCGWKLTPDYCRPDNCSMRPMPLRQADGHAAHSTDIAAAWGVVEYLKHHGFSHFQVWGHLDVWHSAFANVDHEFWSNEVMAPTAPLAICRAALKAVQK